MLAWELKDDVVPEEFIEAGRIDPCFGDFMNQSVTCNIIWYVYTHTPYAHISMLIYSLNIWDNLIWENDIWWMTWTWWWFHPQGSYGISTDFVGDVSKRLDLKNLVQVRVVLRTHHYNLSWPPRMSRSLVREAAWKFPYFQSVNHCIVCQHRQWSV